MPIPRKRYGEASEVALHRPLLLFAQYRGIDGYLEVEELGDPQKATAVFGNTLIETWLFSSRLDSQLVSRPEKADPGQRGHRLLLSVPLTRFREVCFGENVRRRHIHDVALALPE